MKIERSIYQNAYKQFDEKLFASPSVEFAPIYSWTWNDTITEEGILRRLDEMQAAFLRVKLPHLDKWNADRKRIAEKYFKGITNPLIKLPLASSGEYEHIYHVFVIRCDRRDELERYLNENGIGTVKHYPIPMHLQKAYKDLGLEQGDLPIAEEISNTVLSIPMYYSMTDEEVEYVIEILNKFE